MTFRVTFQGIDGAYSQILCRHLFPDAETAPCLRFDECLEAVARGEAERAVLPVDNAYAGRIADIHRLLPETDLRIVGEEFLEVSHSLVAPAGATLDSVVRVHSHEQALAQCRDFLRGHGMEGVKHADTAGAARHISEIGGVADGALSSSLAARAYGLEILATDAQDDVANTTRFLVLARDDLDYESWDGDWMTSFLFRVRSVPAALYKALGGFATNGVNITKLESYIVDARFRVAQFYADVEGHPRDRGLRLALEELGFFTEEVRVLGSYAASSFRRDGVPVRSADVKV
ncbi:MAG: prephenate dehydratase [Alphaproteobacteria bacterium]|nr:prephenate dehydratase [Alphaproteobacteria bacterium]MDA8004919.1 prephenate dehydratase [Alphaproteobacteria bacterium]MDA8006017.1 prephenate dehydratase [Alphaproteobacteria bacterium]MDA8013763.1 prephenate dehydratase [Alphaproteobacteria bacterium]